MTIILTQVGDFLLRVKRYMGKHIVGVSLFFILLFVFAYWEHQHYVNPIDVYTISKLSKDTTNERYSVNTYDRSAKTLSKFSSLGLNLGVSSIGNLSGGKKANVDTVNIYTYRGDISISGSTILAYPSSMHNVIDLSEVRNNYIEYAASKIKGTYSYTSSILMVKTYDGVPIVALYGNNIKAYYCDINNSQVFSIDGNIIYCYKATYSISKTSIFK